MKRSIPPPPPGLEWPKARLNRGKNKVVCTRCGNWLASRQRTADGQHFILAARDGWVDQPREGVWSEAKHVWRHPDPNPSMSRTNSGTPRFKPRAPKSSSRRP